MVRVNHRPAILVSSTTWTVNENLVTGPMINRFYCLEHIAPTILMSTVAVSQLKHRNYGTGKLIQPAFETPYIIKLEDRQMSSNSENSWC